MRAVVADAGPLYALFDPDDGFHVRARGEIERLNAEHIAVVASYPAVCEAHRLAVRRLGPASANKWLDEIKRGCNLINPSRVHYDAATQRLAALADQPISLFDAVLAEVAEHLELPVWTYDHHFDVMGVPVWR